MELITYLSAKYDEVLIDGSKVMRSKMEHLWITFLETRGKGKFDMKRTGFEMSNGNGMNCLMNFERVTSAMLAACEEGNEERDWFADKIPKWNKLTAALYDTACFFKSQKKRDPEQCDQILYALWCG